MCIQLDTPFEGETVTGYKIVTYKMRCTTRLAGTDFEKIPPQYLYCSISVSDFEYEIGKVKCPRGTDLLCSPDFDYLGYTSVILNKKDAVSLFKTMSVHNKILLKMTLSDSLRQGIFRTVSPYFFRRKICTTVVGGKYINEIEEVVL